MIPVAVPESVYDTAARADAERYIAVSGAVGIDMDATARLMARDPALRTIAASAYRAGYERGRTAGAGSSSAPAV